MNTKLVSGTEFIPFELYGVKKKHKAQPNSTNKLNI